MLRRLRRPVVALVPALLLVTLAGCGGSSDSNTGALTIGKTASRLDAVKITGDVGSEPKLDWSAQMTATSVASTTLIKGDGPTVAKGDSVLAHIVIANGFTKQVAFSTYDKDKGPQTLVDGSKLGPLFLKAIDGARIGSRVAVTASGSVGFPPTGNAQLAIGNEDPVLAIVDLMSEVTSGPKGTQTPAPSWMPKLRFGKNLKPTGFDFTGVPTPKGQFRKAILITGTGPKVALDQTVVVDYLGEVYGGTKPFDENYTTGPLTKALTTLIKGWQSGLVGVPVGSRVVLQVPPKLGYGSAGNTQAGIKSTDTLFFVIDILATG